MQKAFAVSKLAVVPIRKKPDDRSEMVTQLLFGECVELLESVKPNWSYIRVCDDDYFGFVDPKQVYSITEEDFLHIQKPTKFVMQSGFASLSNDASIHLTMGASLPNFDGLSFKMPFGKVRFADQIIDIHTANIDGSTVEKIARKYIGCPYLWGGRSPFGLDCSGLTQIVYKMLGFELPRDASDQARLGDSIAFIDSAQTGDLAFFQSETNRIIHVGIITEDRKIIHASGEVRTDLIDHQGIYNESTKSYTHQLRRIKRIIGSRKVKSRAELEASV